MQDRLAGQSQQAPQAPPAETTIEPRFGGEAVAAKPGKLASRRNCKVSWALG